MFSPNAPESPREIAADLGLPETIVAKDLRRLHKALLRRGQRHLTAEGLRAVDVYKRIQRVLWDGIDELRDEGDHKAVAPFARALTDTQKAIDAMNERINRDLNDEEDGLALRDIVAQFGHDEIEAAAQPHLENEAQPSPTPTPTTAPAALDPANDDSDASDDETPSE